MPTGAHDVTLPMEADSAMPASTAGVLQSGSSEELATALAGLTQMVSTARGMPTPGHQQQELASRDALAALQQTPASQNRTPQSHIEEGCGGVLNDDHRDERLSGGLCTLDVRPCIEHSMIGSQAAEPRNKDQDVAGSAQVDKGSPPLRPPKRARLVPPTELLHDPPELTGSNLPEGRISEPAQPVTGLHPCGTARSSAPCVSQLQQQAAGASAAPEPTGGESGPVSPADGVNHIWAVVAAEGQAAASLRLQVLKYNGGHLKLDEQQKIAAAAGQPGDADAEGSFSTGPINAYSKELRAILRGDAAPSTSTDKSSPHSHQRSVHGAQVSCPVPSPTKDSAQHRASFAFVQPEGARVRGTIEQLTPALPARAACSAAPEAEPIARRGASGDIVPDSEEHTTPPHQDDRGSQLRGSAHALECSAQPSFKVAEADGGHPGIPHTEQQGEGADAGYCRAALTGAADQAMGDSSLSTPHGTQLGASGGPGSCPGSAERERLLAQAAGMPAAAAAALLESQRGSNSPNKRKLPQPRRPQDCGTSSGSGSPASQAPSSHRRSSSGKDLACLAAASSQRGASSQPSPLCPTRLGQHRLADASSQPDASPFGCHALHHVMPQSQAACDGTPAATGMATCGSQSCVEAAGGHAGMDAARLETAVRLKWLRAVRVLHRMACRWHVPPAQQTWSSDVRVPISRDSSADASHHRPSDAPHNSSSRSQDARAPHQPTGHAVVSPLGVCAVGEAAADTVPGKNHSDGLASSDWRTARSHGSGGVSHAGGQSIQGRCSGGPAQVSEKRRREAPMEGEESQIAERACSQDDSAGQMAADSSHQNKRLRTEEGWSAGGSQRADPLAQGALMRQILGTQPAGAMYAQEEAKARIGSAQHAHVHGCAPAAMEADSDVDIGGPDDLDQPSGSHSIAPGDHPLTQLPPQSVSTQGGAPSQAAGTQAGLMHSSEELYPPCGQPLPPPHLSLGERAEEYGRTPAALLLRTPMERSPWATPHFSHPHTAERSHPDAPCSQRPAANDPAAGPSAAGASGQNATMRVLSLEGRPSPGWTPGLLCSGTGAATEMPQCSNIGGTVPDALHRLARGAPFADPTGDLSLQQGSRQPSLMTQSERPDHPEAGARQQLGGLGLQGLQALGESQHYEACHSLDGLLYGASQNSDRSLPLSQPASTLP
ncbi:g2121 [Coccomyxa elongata]